MRGEKGIEEIMRERQKRKKTDKGEDGEMNGYRTGPKWIND